MEDEFAHLYKRWPKKSLTKTEIIRSNSINNPLSSVRFNDVENVEVKMDSVFRGVDRLKIIHSIITYYGQGGCSLNPNMLVEKECILCYTPLHDPVS